MESIQIRHVIVTSFKGLPYLKVTLNSRVLKSYLLSLHFYFSIENTRNNLRDFIQILNVYVTGYR